MKILARPLSLVLTFIVSGAIFGCRPSAPSEFKASQDAFQKISRVSVEWSSQNDLGSFQQTAELDCSGGYYHRHIVKDLSAKGAADTRSALGAPLWHQDTEYLFVDGRSYERSSGQFGFDAKPSWVRSVSNFNPKSYCQDLQAGKDPEDGPFGSYVHFIPVVDFKQVLSDNKLQYVADRISDDGPCREYSVTYSSNVESSSRPTPNGAYVSFEMKPVDAKMCLGPKDHLPRQVEQDGWMVKYSYGEIQKLAAPAVAGF